MELFEQIETFVFRVYSVQQRRGNTDRTKFYPLARAVHQGETGASAAISDMGEHVNYYCDSNALWKVFDQNAIYTYYGDSRKDEIRYLLYFYEKHLEEDMKGLDFDLRTIVKTRTTISPPFSYDGCIEIVDALGESLQVVQPCFERFDALFQSDDILRHLLVHSVAHAPPTSELVTYS